MASIQDYIVPPMAPPQGPGPDFATLGRVPARLTGGAFAIVEHPIAPGVLVAPVHTHTREDELSYVLAGQVGILIGQEEAVAGPGSYVFKPRGIPHTFWNAGETPARIMEIICPAGFEQYLEKLSAIMAQRQGQGQPDMGALMALGAEYGLSFDMAATGQLLQKHRLKLS